MNKRGGGKGAARVKLIAFGMFLAGSAGALAGRLLQAAVSRRREHLADASAVQFTRNPQALQGAFIVMAANAAGTRLEHERAVDVAHMFFAGSPTDLGRASSAPPGSPRIRRSKSACSALDARMSPLKFRTLVSDERRKLARESRGAAADGASRSAPEASAAAAGSRRRHSAAWPWRRLAASAQRRPATADCSRRSCRHRQRHRPSPDARQAWRWPKPCRRACA